MKISRKRVRDVSKLRGTDKPIKEQTFVRVVEMEIPTDEPLITHQEMELRRLRGNFVTLRYNFYPFKTRIQKYTSKWISSFTTFTTTADMIRN